MGVYFNSAIVGNDRDYLEDHITESAYTPDIKGVFRNILDIERNYNAMMEAVGIAEIQAYANGEDLFMNEASVEGFFAKVKEFFKMIWRKIQEIFNKFLALLNSLTMSDKGFVKKWKTTILKASTKDFTFKGYKFKIKEYTDTFNNYVDSAKGEVSKIKYTDSDKETEIDNKTKIFTEDKEKFKEELRGLILGKKQRYETGEFHDELFEMLRNGSSEKETLDEKDFNISDYFKYIEDYKDDKKEAEKMMKTIKDAINVIIRDLDSEEKSFKGSDDPLASHKLRNLSATNEAYKATLEYAQEANGLVLSALKQRRMQAKMVCVKLVGRKESVEYSSNNFFDVQFK